MEGVITGRTPKPRRVVLAGMKGIGKSTWAAGAPDPIFIPTEDGLDDIGPSRYAKAETFDEVFNRFKRLGEDEHGYRTAVVDSLDALERLIFAEVCKSKGVENIEDIGYAKGYTFALDWWRRIIACCDYLRNERGMNVILIAHTKVDKFEDPENANYDYWTLQLHKHATSFITQWADEVFFAKSKLAIRSTKEGFGREKARAMDLGERVIMASHKPSHVAKNRLDMPDEIPFPKVGGWDVYAKYIQAHHDSKPIAAAAPPVAESKESKGRKKAVAS